MAADAVLLIHMDKRPVGIMKPSMRSLGDVPVMRIALRAIRRCKLLCSTAIAIIKPEMKGWERVVIVQTVVGEALTYSFMHFVDSEQ